LLSRQVLRCLPVLAVAMGAGPALSQTTPPFGSNITSITLDPVRSIAAPQTVNGITYKGQSQSLRSFNTGSTIWDLASAPANVIFRRSGTAGAVNNRQVVWERQNTSATNLRGPAPTTTQAALQQNNIFLGTDNLFTNTGNSSGNQSDVERVDFIFSRSFTAAANAGVTVFERGATGAHDAFGIAAIVGFDTNNNPLFGNLLRFGAGSWGQPSLTGGNSYTVLNNSSGQFAQTATVNQDIGGVLIRLSELATPGTQIFGYALFGPDITVGTNLTNFSAFPNNTPETTTGIDLVAANLGITKIRGTIVPEPSPLPTAIPLILGLGWLVRRRLTLEANRPVEATLTTDRGEIA